MSKQRYRKVISKLDRAMDGMVMLSRRLSMHDMEALRKHTPNTFVRGLMTTNDHKPEVRRNIIIAEEEIFIE